MTQLNQSRHYEMIIVGTGMVGSLLAIALAPYVDSILLLDKMEHDFNRQMNVESRPLSLNHASVEALKQCDVWQDLKDYATLIKQVHVSQNGYWGTTQFKAQDYNLEALGCVVPADVLALTLLKKARELSVVDFERIDNIQSVNQDNQIVQLNYEVKNKSIQISSDFLFGCDGTYSKVAQLIGAEQIKEGEPLQALVCDLVGADLNGVAYERFTKQGTLALLPKLAGNAGLVFTGKHAEIDRLSALSDDAFIQHIQALMGDRLPSKLRSTPGAIKPLNSLRHVPLYLGQVLLLGNAARTLYPIAAQGFNLGLRDVMQLQSVFACAKDIQSNNPEKLIKTFIDFRAEDQKKTSQMTSKIGDVFSKDYEILSHLRGLGLIGLDLITPLKNKMANRALGIAGGVKRVLKL